MSRIPIEFTFEDENFKKMAAQMEELYKNAKKFQDAINGKGSGGGGTKKNNENLRATVATMEKLEAKMRAYRQESARAGKTIHGMQSEMKALKIQAQLATDPSKARKYTKEIQRLNREITKAKNTTGTWSKAMGSFQFKFNALGNIAANVASSITNNITKAIRGAIDTTIEFEKTFAEVLTLLSRADKLKFESILKQGSLKLMTQYGLAVDDVNKAMFDAISAGIKLGDVTEFMNSAARLAVGGVTDLNSSVKGLASVMNAFNLSGSEAENVASAFFQAQKFGITYIDDMVGSMGRVNTIATLTGASYREMLASFAAITKVGLNTEEAITGLRNVFKELVSPSRESRQEFERFGIATGSTAVKQEGFVKILESLQRVYIQNNDSIAKMFGNIRGLTGITGLLGDNFETFMSILKDVNDEMGSSESLNNAVEIQMDTTAKAVDRLTSSWKAFIVEISESDGAVKDIIDSVAALLNGIRELNKGDTLLESLGMDAPGLIESAVNKEASAIRAAASNIVRNRDEMITATTDGIREHIDKYTTMMMSIRGQNDDVSRSLVVLYADQLQWLNKLLDAKKSEEAFAAAVADEEAAIESTKLTEQQYKEWLKIQKQKLKDQYELNKAILELQTDGNKKELQLENLSYEYNKDLIELTVKDEESKYTQLQVLFVQHINNVAQIAEQAVKDQEERSKRYNEAFMKSFEMPDEEYIEDGLNEFLDAYKEGQEEIERFAKENPIWAAMGFDEESMREMKSALRELEDAIGQITDAVVAAASARVDAVQREIDASDERTSQIQRDRDHEWDRMQEGYANNYALKQKELEDEKKRKEQLKAEEEKALRAEQRAKNIRIAIDTALTVSKLILAGASLLEKEISQKGIIGVVIALAGIGAMVAGMFSLKANANNVAGFADGVIDLNGDGTERSDSIDARLSKGESVMTAKATKRNKNNLTTIQRNPNHPLFQLTEKLGADNVLNALSNNMSVDWNNTDKEADRWNEMLFKEMKQYNSFMKGRPYSYQRGKKIITVDGNEETVIKL